MECPKCESKAYVAKVEPYRHRAGEPIEEIRTYICSNPDCAKAFRYRNTFLNEAEARDALRWLRSYEQRKKRQRDLFNSNTEEQNETD